MILTAAATPLALAAEQSAQQPARSANDKMQIALIGAGGQGMSDARVSIGQGAKLVAVADIYDGRLARSKENWGKDIFTTRDYREVLARPDVDAIIIATPDHWHQKISIDALDAGKNVYCEKPMVQRLSDGHDVIDARAEERDGFSRSAASESARSCIRRRRICLRKARSAN